MSKEKKEKTNKVRTSVLSRIKVETLTFFYITEEMLKDHYTGSYKVSEADLLNLLELRISSGVLKKYENSIYFTQI